MAIKLIANYSKRLGLPGYSSHQFSVSVEAELLVTDDIAGESARLYQLLQTSVDEQIQQTGFVPGIEYGMDSPADSSPNHGQNPSVADHSWRQSGAWKCSAKQRDLILNLVAEHQLDKAQVEQLAVSRFGKGVRLLNKVEASGLIDELIDTHGGGRQTTAPRNGSAYAGAQGRRTR